MLHVIYLPTESTFFHYPTIKKNFQNMEKVVGKTIPFKIIDRRPGDIATCYANPSKARKELGWSAQFDIHRMCQDAWRWQSKHPNGYC